MPDLPPEAHIIRAGDKQGRGGLYNMLVPGGFERAALLLPVVGINPDAGPEFRLRDAWVESDPAAGLAIHVYTRIGGNNREDYAGAIAALCGLDTYLRDADDTFDNTYASFWFRVPAGYADQLAELAVPPVDTGRRWKDLAASLGNAGQQE